MLSRKMMLESKSFRHQLNLEVTKHKETQRELHSALTTITKLENQLIIRDKIVLLTTSTPKKNNVPLKCIEKNNDVRSERTNSGTEQINSSANIGQVEIIKQICDVSIENFLLVFKFSCK